MSRATLPHCRRSDSGHHHSSDLRVDPPLPAGQLDRADRGANETQGPYEFGLVTFPAYAGATAERRSIASIAATDSPGPPSGRPARAYRGTPGARR